MSERRIGESSLGPVNDLVVSTQACRGAPDSIQPGAVVAMADSLRTLLALAEFNDPGQSAIRHARSALAMYNGEEA